MTIIKLRYLILFCIAWAAFEAADSVAEPFLTENPATTTPALPNGALPNEPFTIIRSDTMQINYQTNLIPADLSRVELWYSQGPNGKWQLYDYDLDKTAPVSFIAPGEGVFRFLVVAVDLMGRRSCPVQPAEQVNNNNIDPFASAQMMVFIDFTPPQLFLQSPIENMELYTGSNLNICWAGFDANLGTRPVNLSYQDTNVGPWRPICPALDDIGEYIWQVPQHLTGSIKIKAVITDRAGHQAVKYSGLIKLINNHTPPANKLTTPAVKETISSVPQTANISPVLIQNHTNNPTSAPISPQTEPASKSYLPRAAIYEQRLDWDKAAQTYQKILDNDPSNISVQLKLADSLYRMGRFSPAMEHYKLFLQSKPNHYSALMGQAQTQMALKQFDKTQITLEKLLMQDQEDWQSWLLYGDAADELGHKDLAVKSWQRATKSNLPFIVRSARERLEKK